MSLKGIIQYSHYLLEESVNDGETVVDATCGNGNDTLFLSELVGNKGHVYAFDIQKQAIQTTRHLLEQHSKKNVTLIYDSHAHIDQYIANEQTIGGAIFNLGYLPKSDKTIITRADTTITALDKILMRLKRQGIVVLVIYHGHDGGKEEKKAILKHVIHLNQQKFTVLRYGFINQKNDPPFIIAIGKK